MLQSKVGLEAEFLLLNAKNEAIVPPKIWDRDGFPLLGEVRGEPGKDAPEVISNFTKRFLEIKNKVNKNNKIVMVNIQRIRLAIYKEAMKQVTEAKSEQLGKVKNINGINIDDYSDQIIGDNGKIQGINVSCGLHIHFSCNEVVTKTIEDVKYTLVTLPIKLAEVSGENTTLKELIKPEIHLYSKENLSGTRVKKLTASASIITKPVVEFIVSEMDKMFFERFAPIKKDRTKYRRPGFYELKPYGFEYRSLPANEATIEALPEIIGTAFDLLKSLTKQD